MLGAVSSPSEVPDQVSIHRDKSTFERGLMGGSVSEVGLIRPCQVPEPEEDQLSSRAFVIGPVELVYIIESVLPELVGIRVSPEIHIEPIPEEVVPDSDNISLFDFYCGS